MNAAEHIIEAYFRLVKGCFTLGDIKVLKGNNRQFDLLAYSIKEKKQFHIEVSVTHQENWCPQTPEELFPAFEKKFFGAPPKRKDKNRGTTDHEKGKSYFDQIKATYEKVGFSPDAVQRIWVCWIIKDGVNNNPIDVPDFAPSNLHGEKFSIEILSMRDCILPALEEHIGSANYEDEILRTLGFMKQRQAQKK